MMSDDDRDIDIESDVKSFPAFSSLLLIMFIFLWFIFF